MNVFQILEILKSKTGLSVNDLAKRLIDYSFHAPTISWPVPETIMIEPTESESLAEVDRFCEAMLLIGEEISEIENNHELKNNNVISNAPHTLKELIADNWQYPYSKEKASFPYKTPTTIKFWTSVSRINNAYGDRNLICSCNVNQDETLEEKKMCLKDQRPCNYLVIINVNKNLIFSYRIFLNFFIKIFEHQIFLGYLKL